MTHKGRPRQIGPSRGVAPGELAAVVIAIVVILAFLALGGPSIVGQLWADLAGTP